MVSRCVFVLILTKNRHRKVRRKQPDLFQASFLQQRLGGKDFQLVPQSSLVAGLGFWLSTMTLELWFWALKIT